MYIASKEARETKYWISLIQETQLINLDFNMLNKEINDIINILTAIIKTSKKNLDQTHSTKTGHNS
jgi:four helix bundle protein